MITLCTSNNIKLKLLLLPLNYTQLYNKLKVVLSQNEFSFFAKPESNGNNTFWTYDVSSTNSYKSFDNLQEDEKENAIDELESLKYSVFKKLNESKDKDLKSIVSSLFAVPDNESIKAIFLDNKWKIVITQWGCSNLNANSGSDTISALFAKPRLNSDIVILNFLDKYSKETVSNFPFSINYQNVTLSFVSDQNGNYNRGRCKIGSDFIVNASLNKKNRELAKFEVLKGHQYNVFVPSYQDISIKVINQKGEPIINAEIEYKNLDKADFFITNDEGLIFFNDVETGTEIDLLDKLTSKSLKLKIEKDKDYYEFVVERTKFFEAVVTVVNVINEVLPDFELAMLKNDNTANLITDSNGKLLINGCKAEEEIVFLNLKNSNNKVTCKIKEDAANEFTIVIEEIINRDIKVSFIDYKKRPIKNKYVVFKVGDKKINVKTNEQGDCIFKELDFTNNQKVEVSVMSKLKSFFIKKENQ
jgi:hypothetical protein